MDVQTDMYRDPVLSLTDIRVGEEESPYTEGEGFTRRKGR